MNRHEWKLAYRELRQVSKGSADISAHSYGRGKARGWHMLSIKHGGTFWTLKHVRDAQGASATGLLLYPAIIRDRALQARLNDALIGCAQMRREAAAISRADTWNAYRRALLLDGARLFIRDARELRAGASAFHAIAA